MQVDNLLVFEISVSYIWQLTLGNERIMKGGNDVLFPVALPVQALYLENDCIATEFV